MGGGLELALSADLIYLSSKARVGLPEVGLGLIPGFGGTQRLSRIVGLHVARELIYTGAHIGAERALELGIALRVFEPEALLDEVIAIARTIASKAPRAVRAAKRVVEQGFDMPLEQALLDEQRAFEQLFSHEEPREGMSAYLEKRIPSFSPEAPRDA